MQVFPLADLLDIIDTGRRGTVREVRLGETADFLQGQDKLCTGMMGRKPNGGVFSFDLNPPVMLVAGTEYVIDLD